MDILSLAIACLALIIAVAGLWLLFNKLTETHQNLKSKLELNDNKLINLEEALIRQNEARITEELNRLKIDFQAQIEVVKQEVLQQCQTLINDTTQSFQAQLTEIQSDLTQQYQSGLQEIIQSLQEEFDSKLSQSKEELNERQQSSIQEKIQDMESFYEAQISQVADELKQEHETQFQDQIESLQETHQNQLNQINEELEKIQDDLAENRLTSIVEENVTVEIQVDDQLTNPTLEQPELLQKHPELNQEIIELGNSGRVVYIPQLSQYIYHPDSEVRELVASALGNIVANKPVRQEVKKAIELLGKLSRDEESTVRATAIKSLGKIQSESVIPFVKIGLHDADMTVVKFANEALSKFKFYPKKSSTKQSKQKKKLPKNH